jgi:hypothetical protein
MVELLGAVFFSFEHCILELEFWKAEKDFSQAVVGRRRVVCMRRGITSEQAILAMFLIEVEGRKTYGLT